jgi:hypothetical protein
MNSFNNIYGYLSASAKPKRGACINVIIVASREEGKKEWMEYLFFVSFYARIRREESNIKSAQSLQKKVIAFSSQLNTTGAAYSSSLHTHRGGGNKGEGESYLFFFL